MSAKQNLEQLDKLKQRGMSECYGRQLSDPSVSDWSFDERFAQIIHAQVHDNDERRLQRFIRNAKLKISNASIEDLDLNITRGLDKSHIATLNTLQWIDYHQNLLVVGATGTGKTYIACAYAMQCIRRGMPAIYKRLSRLMEEMALARVVGTLPKLMVQLQKPQLLVIDDWGLSPLTPQNRLDLLEIIEDRSGNGSIAVTSQLPIGKWHEYIGESTIADAILDRLVHSAHRIELKGESMRKLTANLEEKS